MPSTASDRVDLRSDTVTKPSVAMLEAMMSAEVGDDVLGDDPTVNALQERICKILDKQAALFMPSATMCNAVAVRTQTKPGDEIVAEATCHIYLYEGGGFSALSGCSIALVQGERGIMRAEDVALAIRKSAGSLSHFPDATLVSVENSHNRGGGTLYTVQAGEEIVEVARQQGCATHLDGSRLFNASVALGSTPAALAAAFDTVTICLSKGLGCPVGSLLVGSAETIARAHRFRKMFGGGMRQSGVIAAAGLYALEHNVQRLEQDHQNIIRLAVELDAMHGFEVDMQAVQTNMVYIEVDAEHMSAERSVSELATLGIDILALGPQTLRAVTHLDVSSDGIDQAIAAFAGLAA
jgi:threonine aldolase